MAITNSSMSMAFPRPALPNDASLIASLLALAEEEGVTTIVVGRPVSLSGNETSSTQRADTLFNTLVERFAHIEIVQWDERFTTYEAQRSLQEAGLKAKEQREHLDSAAAVIMLQNYVDGFHVE
ncbi:MAG: Holliday junction resolvase RuvX [Acidimicrobiales bacterium]